MGPQLLQAHIAELGDEIVVPWHPFTEHLYHLLETLYVEP